MSAPRHTTLDSNGLRFPTLELGPSDGPVVLCLHGFPDTHHGWFEGGEGSFAAHLAAAGFRVVAPAMRGVTPETLPADGDYAPTTLAQDVVAHAAALGGKVMCVANDWGALQAYLAVAMAPERFTRLVALGIPHPLSIKPSLKLAWKARHFVTFRFQRYSARLMRKGGFAYVDTLYRRWSPGWRYPPSAVAAVKAAYAQPGVVEGALAPYATLVRDKKKTDAILKGKIAVPTLALGGGADPTVPASAYAASQRGFSAPFAWDFVPGVGHFPQREDPKATAERVIAFLRSGPA